ncbi:hypothetical protein HMPREF9350_06095 [Escherichia coli MS 85-1]|uniref:Uncharacterized protein n=1 Tax=Escherichia coli MS 85-1 TaxID=679202 RepID=A0AAN3M3I8_ECOLX|nr:hypothetical protein HMPREF9350_06095 [Escherichia coli MS 85-1]
MMAMAVDSGGEEGSLIMPINSGVVAVVMALVNVFTCLRVTASGAQN